MRFVQQLWAAIHFQLPGRAPRRMQVVERLPLTPQHSLHLVRIDGRLLVVASGPGGCSVLEEKPPCSA
jgi:flagellar biogenesis protein FliO